MNMPQGLKPAAWGAVGGAVAVAIIGFSWGGWMTGGSAADAASRSAKTAVIAALAPICAAQFRNQPDAAGQLAALKELGGYKQSEFVVTGGWATMPGSEAPENGVAYSCAEILTTST